MKTIYLLFAVSFLTLTGCSTTHRSANGIAHSETVLITYHVQPGKEAELQTVLAHAWEIYLNEHMVFHRPHVIVRAAEDGDKTRLVEVFTWVKTPDHASDKIKAIWQQEHSLCEERNGRVAIAGGEVTLITGR